MYTVQRNQLMFVNDPCGKDYLVQEASMLGLPPGQWPEAIRVVSPFGEALEFGHRTANTDMVLEGSMEYTTEDGQILRIWND